MTQFDLPSVRMNHFDNITVQVHKMKSASHEQRSFSCFSSSPIPQLSPPPLIPRGQHRPVSGGCCSPFVDFTLIRQMCTQAIYLCFNFSINDTLSLFNSLFSPNVFGIYPHCYKSI